jgi:predicted nucleic acid-binding protein
MNRVVVDASALAAAVFQEPEGGRIRQQLEDAVVFAPALLTFELASVAWKKLRRQPDDAAKLVAALAIALSPESGIVMHDVDPAEVVLVAQTTGLTVYDAAYLWLAGALGADLVTLDARVAAAGALLNG